MNSISKVIGEQLRNLRKERGLSQEELAHLASLHPTYIGQVERGEKNITVETLDKITRALEISLEELFRFIQPAALDGSNNFNLSEIINRLLLLSADEQKKVLNVIDIVLSFKRS